MCATLVDSDKNAIPFKAYSDRVPENLSIQKSTDSHSSDVSRDINALKINLEYRMWKDVFVASSSAWHCVLAIFECTTNKNTNHIYNVINLC